MYIYIRYIYIYIRYIYIYIYISCDKSLFLLGRSAQLYQFGSSVWDLFGFLQAAGTPLGRCGNHPRFGSVKDESLGVMDGLFLQAYGIYMGFIWDLTVIYSVLRG